MSTQRKMPDRETFRRMCQTMTSSEIAEATGASLPSVCRWGAEYNCSPLRGAWGGSRPRGCKSAPTPYQVRDIPLPATPGPLSYWARVA